MFKSKIGTWNENDMKANDYQCAYGKISDEWEPDIIKNFAAI